MFDHYPVCFKRFRIIFFVFVCMRNGKQEARMSAVAHVATTK